jgi:hypothetical protein
MTAAAGPAAAAKPPESQPMDENTGGYGKHNPRGPPGAPGIIISDGQGMYRKPRADQYAKSKPSAPPPGPSYSSIIGPAPGGPPPKGPGPSAGPSASPPAIAVSGTKNPAQPGVVAKVKRAKTRMVEEPIHHPIRPKPIAVTRRPPRPLVVVPTELEVSKAKRYKKAEEEVLGVAPDTEAKPTKSKGRGTKKEPNPSKGYGTIVKPKPKIEKDAVQSKGYGSKVKTKAPLKSPATTFKRVSTKKSVDVTDNEPDKEVPPRASKGKSSKPKPKPAPKGKGYGTKVQKPQVKEPTTAFTRRRLRSKTTPEKAIETTPSPKPPPAPDAEKNKKPTKITKEQPKTPTPPSKNTVELNNLLKSLNNTASKNGLSDQEKDAFRELMRLIKTEGPETVNKALVKQAMITYNKSTLGKKHNAAVAAGKAVKA